MSGSSLNVVHLIGNLGKDPELKATKNELPYCRFSIATKDISNRGGEKQERTEWHNIMVWGKAAESCVKYLSKGSKVFVDGKLQTNKYEKDGKKMEYTQIVSRRVIFLDPKDKVRLERTEDNDSMIPEAKGMEIDEIPF